MLHIKRIWILRNEVKWASSISWVLLACTNSSDWMVVEVAMFCIGEAWQIEKLA